MSANRRFFLEEAFLDATAAAAAAAAADPGPTGGPDTIGPRISTGLFEPGGGPIIPTTIRIILVMTKLDEIKSFCTTILYIFLYVGFYLDSDGAAN